MPTGYTADVADGKVTEFRDFALTCARAFGATIMQRDAPITEAPKHREVGSYYYEWIARDEAKIAALDAMTDADADAGYAAERAEAETHLLEWREEKATKRLRYEAMLALAEDWEPPTHEHLEMAKFMCEQLRQSMDSDCGGTWEPDAPVFASGSEWRSERRRQAVESLARSRKSLDEELVRCRTANAWIDALYASLPATASSTPMEPKGNAR